MRTLLSGVRIGPAQGRAVLVDDSVIAWIGTARDAPDTDRVLDLSGCLLLPAFVDAHVHATSTGLSLTGLDLHGTASLSAALERIAAHADRHPGEVIFGTGWDETTWPERRAPSLTELDTAVRGTPAYLARVDVHSAVVSTALLERCPRAPEAIGFDPGGQQRQEAHHLLRRAVTDTITVEQRRAAQRTTRSRSAELGVASFHEMAGPDISGRPDLESLLGLAATEPGPSVVGYWGELGEVNIVAELGLAGAAGDLFCDGAFGSHTAALWEPYFDAPATTGALYFADEEVTDHLRAATRADVQGGFHCIGDAAIDQVARAMETVAAEFGDAAVRRCRHRLEHLEMPSASALATFGRLNVVASVQPAFDSAWGGHGRMYETRLGSRAEALNPLNDIVAAGLILSFGSDAPVTPIDPWSGVVGAVRHRSRASRLTTEQALTAATVGAWQAGRDRRAGNGRLEIGAPANLAAWDLPGPADSAEPVQHIIDAMAGGAPAPSCVLTMSDGEIIHGSDPC